MTMEAGDVMNSIVVLMERELSEEQALVARLTDSERADLGAPERWSARGVLSHVAFWKQHMADNLMAVLDGGKPEVVDDLDAINAQILAKNAGKPWQEVLETAAAAHSALLSASQSIPLSWLASDEIFPWQEGRPLWRLLVGEAFIHPIGHYLQFYLESGRSEHARALQLEQQRGLEALDDSPSWRGTLRYNLACFLAQQGDIAGAASALTDALLLRPDLEPWSKDDPDFTTVREDPRFQAVYDRA